jgi:hypothetical protein
MTLPKLHRGSGAPYQTASSLLFCCCAVQVGPASSLPACSSDSPWLPLCAASSGECLGQALSCKHPASQRLYRRTELPAAATAGCTHDTRVISQGESCPGPTASGLRPCHVPLCCSYTCISLMTSTQSNPGTLQCTTFRHPRCAACCVSPAGAHPCSTPKLWALPTLLQQAGGTWVEASLIS